MYETKNLLFNSFWNWFNFIFSQPLKSNTSFGFNFKRIPLLLGSIFILLSVNLTAQNKFSDNLFLEANYGRGYILPEYQFLNYVVEDYVNSLEISVGKVTSGKTEWERLYKYPSYGFRFIYSDLGSPFVLGKLYGGYPYFRITLANFTKFNTYLESGIGISYVTKKFDLEDNFLNVAVGSNLNMHFNFRAGLEYHLIPRLKIHSSFSFDHFSNANTSEPNLGINYLTWNSGLSYAIGKTTERNKQELSPNPKELEKEIVLNIGGKHTRELSSKYYLTNSLSFEIRKKYFRALHLGVGTDLFYDSSVKDQLSEDQNKFKNIFFLQSGIHFSQTIVYNRFSLTIQEGIYLGLKERVENNFMYNRGIVKYFITQNISARISMKSHLHILDYPEIGIGIKL